MAPINETTQAKWQWEHRSGFRDFSKEESDRIEKQFQLGEWMMRLKSGKGKQAKPREVYFYDMVQYDPSSDSTRRVQRTPPVTRFQRFKRRLNTMLVDILHGEDKWWLVKSQERFERRRSMQKKSEAQIRLEKMLIYKEDSRCFRIVSSWTFTATAMAAILLNSAWIGVDAQLNRGSTVLDTNAVFIIVDNIFCLWFTVEVIFRFGAFKRIKYCCQDTWFLFDAVLVLMMIVETWVLQLGVWLFLRDSSEGRGLRGLTVFRAFRLLRLSRLTRLFKIFPQLMVLLKGVTQAMKSLVFTLLMLFVLLFMFGVILKNFADQNEKLREMGLDSLAECMWKLLLYGTFLDSLGEFMNSLREAGLQYALFLLLFIFLSNLTMLNMLIGILCEVVARVAEDEKDLAAKQDLESQVLEILECYDVNDNRRLHKPEFVQLMSNPDMQMILSSHDIDAHDLAKLEDVLFEEADVAAGETDKHGGSPGAKRYKEISFPDFLEKVFQLRGGNSATVTDVVELRGYLSRRFARIEERFLSLPPEPSPPEPALRAAAAAALLPPQAPCGHGEPCLPGQIRTPAAEEKHPMLAFQEAVLHQLMQVQQGQQQLKSEVHELRDKFQCLIASGAAAGTARPPHAQEVLV